jgi:hypothetical protein
MTRPSSQASMPEKVRRPHLDRLAIVYIRQSTLQQVERLSWVSLVASRLGV